LVLNYFSTTSLLLGMIAVETPGTSRHSRFLTDGRRVTPEVPFFLCIHYPLSIATDARHYLSRST
jgi:hypothetical protein